MKSLLLPPRSSGGSEGCERKPAGETPTTRNKTCLVPGLGSKQIKMNWCKLSDSEKWRRERKNAHRSIRLSRQATKDWISTHIQGIAPNKGRGLRSHTSLLLWGLDGKKKRFKTRMREFTKSEAAERFQRIDGFQEGGHFKCWHAIVCCFDEIYFFF